MRVLEAQSNMYHSILASKEIQGTKYDFDETADVCQKVTRDLGHSLTGPANTLHQPRTFLELPAMFLDLTVKEGGEGFLDPPVKEGGWGKEEVDVVRWRRRR